LTWINSAAGLFLADLAEPYFEESSMKVRSTRLAAAISLLTLSGFGAAQDSAKGKSEGSSEMHRIMMSSSKESQQMKMSGDADRDFLTMMRHHHESGIKMAQAELRHGKDAKAQELARKIIDAQKKEIAEIDKLLKRGGAAGTGSSQK
jgi:hypothetical protein